MIHIKWTPFRPNPLFLSLLPTLSLSFRASGDAEGRAFVPLNVLQINIIHPGQGCLSKSPNLRDISRVFSGVFVH